jgi:formate/nitrite transporter FocA (FNT family)
MTELYGSDGYAPLEVARRVATVGVAKARMATLPLAMLVQQAGPATGLATVTWAGMAGTLLPVIAGNLLGGSVLVGLTYHVIYRGPEQPGTDVPSSRPD